MRGLCWLAASVGWCLAGCVSVRWEDADGTVHHLGGVAYQVRDLEHGRVLAVQTLGLGLRLTGEDRGITLGWKSLWEGTPEGVAVDDPALLPRWVLAYLRSEEPERWGRAGPDDGESSTRWGLFYLQEPPELDPTVLYTTHVGLDLGWSDDVNAGAGAGASARHRYVGRARGRGVVQVLSSAPGRDRPESIVLWELTEDASRNPVTAAKETMR